MYIGVLWCGTCKCGKTPPFSPIFQPISMQMCPLHIIREGKASKHAQSKLLIFCNHFTSFLPGSYPTNTLGLYFVVTSIRVIFLTANCTYAAFLFNAPPPPTWAPSY